MPPKTSPKTAELLTAVADLMKLCKENGHQIIILGVAAKASDEALNVGINAGVGTKSAMSAVLMEALKGEGLLPDLLRDLCIHYNNEIETAKLAIAKSCIIPKPQPAQA